MEGLASIALAVARLEESQKKDGGVDSNRDGPGRAGSVNATASTTTAAQRRRQDGDRPSPANTESAQGYTGGADKSSAGTKDTVDKAGSPSVQEYEQRSTTAGTTSPVVPVPPRRDFATEATRLVSTDSFASDPALAAAVGLHTGQYHGYLRHALPPHHYLHHHHQQHHHHHHRHQQTSADAYTNASIGSMSGYPIIQQHPHAPGIIYESLASMAPPPYWHPANAVTDGAPEQRVPGASPSSPLVASEADSSPADGTKSSSDNGSRTSPAPTLSSSASSHARSGNNERAAVTTTGSRASSPTGPSASAVPAQYANIDDVEELARTAPAPPPSTEVITQIRDDDVLCGRGGETNHHPGNVKYRNLVKCYQPFYIVSKRRHKPIISQKIVLIIRNRGGRFLKRDGKSGSWKDVGNVKAREKTSQALREGAPELRNGGGGSGRTDTPARVPSTTKGTAVPAPSSVPPHVHPHCQQRSSSSPPPPATTASPATAAAAAHMTSLAHLRPVLPPAAISGYSDNNEIIAMLQKQQRASGYASHLHSAFATTPGDFSQAGRSPPTLVVAAQEGTLMQRAAKRRRSSLTELAHVVSNDSRVSPVKRAPAPASQSGGGAASKTTAEVTSLQVPSPVSPTSSFSAIGASSDDNDSTSSARSSHSASSSPTASSRKARGPRIKLLKRRLETETVQS